MNRTSDAGHSCLPAGRPARGTQEFHPVARAPPGIPRVSVARVTRRVGVTCLSLQGHRWFHGPRARGPVLLLLLFYLNKILNFSFCTRIELINDAGIISGGQKRDSATHTRGSILPQAPVRSRLPGNPEQNPLSYTVGLPWGLSW